MKNNSSKTPWHEVPSDRPPLELQILDSTYITKISLNKLAIADPDP